MDFYESVKLHAEKVKEHKGLVRTEEATKTALILPFFQYVLGYDVYNPLEFVPEDSSNIGKEKAGSVDYVIYKDGKEAIIIEAKQAGVNLDLHTRQLYEYYTPSKAKFAVLTNGVEYRFYTDKVADNIMDLEPFLTVDFIHLNKKSIHDLKQFVKTEYNEGKIYDAAKGMDHYKIINAAFREQIADPSDGFIKLMIEEIYKGTKRQAVVDKFRPIVKAVISDYITEVKNEGIQVQISASRPVDVKAANALENSVLEIVKTMLRGKEKSESSEMSIHKAHFSIWYMGRLLIVCKYGEGKKTLSGIQFLQPFMEAGCNLQKRERREAYAVDLPENITRYSELIVAAADDIEEYVHYEAKK